MKSSRLVLSALLMSSSLLVLDQANAGEISLNNLVQTQAFRPGPTLPPTGVSCSVIGNCPTKHALVVLMENGGYSLGLPEDVRITTYKCDKFSFDLGNGQNIISAISRIAGQLIGATQCLNPSSWRPTTVPLARYVKAMNQFSQAVTDTVIEDIGRSTIENSRAREVYDRVEILEDNEFRMSNIRSKLTELATDHIIDIHVLAHGSPSLIGPSHSDPRERMTPNAIAGLQNIQGLHLRAIYQQNCFGQFMKDSWMRAGALAVNGSIHVNYMSFGYASFLSRWLNGEEFSDSVNRSVNDWKPFYETLYRFVDIYTHPSSRTARLRNPLQFDLLGRLDNHDELDASAMAFSGHGDIKVDSDWLGVSPQ